jgi:hypothetical protein
VCYLNGHGQNMCPRTDPNRQIRTTPDTKIRGPAARRLPSPLRPPPSPAPLQAFAGGARPSNESPAHISVRLFAGGICHSDFTVRRRRGSAGNLASLSLISAAVLLHLFSNPDADLLDRKNLRWKSIHTVFKNRKLVLWST